MKSNKSKYIFAFLYTFFIAISAVINIYISIFGLFVLLVLFLLFVRIELGIFFYLFFLPLFIQLVIIVFGHVPSYFYLGSFLSMLILSNFLVKGRFSIEVDSFKVILFVFSFYLVFSMLIISSFNTYGYIKLVYFFSSLFFLFIPKVLIRCEDDIKIIIRALFLLGIIYVSLSFIYLFEILENPLSTKVTSRFSLYLLNPISLSRDLSYSLIATTYLLISSVKNSKKIGKIYQLSFLMLSLFVISASTGSRGPLISIVGSAFLLFLIYSFNTNFRFGLLIKVILILVVFMSVVFIALPETITDRLINSSAHGQKTFVIRAMLIAEGFNLFLRNSIFGIGFGTFKAQFPLFGEFVYPHNIFIEILSETGLVGFILFGIILIYVVRMLMYLYIKIEFKAFGFILMLFLSSFINANLSGHIGYNIMFWFSIGLIYAFYGLQQKHGK